MQAGLYLTFYTYGEPFDTELPPVGPLEHVVVRDGSLIADRRDADHVDSLDTGGRHLDAEYEFERATGKEPGGVRRPDLRIVAPHGVYLRFVAFGSAAESDPVPELGPYAVVVVGGRTVEADGDALARRAGRKARWELTAAGGSALLGVVRPDIAFRTRSTLYHPAISPFRPVKHPPASAPPAKPFQPASPSPIQTPRADAPRVPAPAPRALAPAPRAESAPEVVLSKTPAPPTRAADVVAPTLRDRIGAEGATRGAWTSTGSDGREWTGAVWKLRFAIIGALIILIAAFSVPSVRSLFTIGTPGGTISTVATGTAVASADWDYRVGSVRRVAKIGTAQARGIFLVVQVAAASRKAAGAQILPSAFALAAAGGEEYSASAVTSGVYSSDVNLTSSYKWPTEFPAGRSVVLPLIFDVDPAVTGTQLVILDIPATRIRLE